MILRLFRRRTQAPIIAALYGAIVAQARTPAFYAEYRVPDTLEGRFDLIVLHLVLLLRRLAREADPAPALGQGLFDAFCRDLDANLREMGVGDLVVPKRMQKFGEAFYGRQAAYLAALAAPDRRVFESALARNIFQSDGVDDPAVRLARYARAAAAGLDARSREALLQGEIAFPRPEGIADARS